MLDALEAAIRTGEFIPPDVDFIKEAQLLVVLDEKPQAAPGAHDDRIMAAAIGWNVVRVPLGLKHTAFGQAPSIAYELTPVSFDNVAAIHQPNINQLVESEQRRWAGATQGDGGWGPVFANKGDMEGF